MPESRPAEVAHRALRQTVTAATKTAAVAVAAANASSHKRSRRARRKILLDSPVPLTYFHSRFPSSFNPRVETSSNSLKFLQAPAECIELFPIRTPAQAIRDLRASTRGRVGRSLTEQHPPRISRRGVFVARVRKVFPQVNVFP
jgi:hypothetical protein